MLKLYPLFLILSSTAAFAQFNLGIATSNWCTMNSIALNPANIADSRELSAINIASFITGVDNNVGAFNAANGLVVAIGDGKTNNMFGYSNNSRVSMLAPYVTLTGPGAMYHPNKRSVIAVTTALRGMNQFNNFDQTMFHSFNDPSYKAEHSVAASPRDFNYTLHVWGELSITYAFQAISTYRHKLKMGIAGRYLGGIAYVGVKGHSMNANFTAGKDTFYASRVDLEYVSNILLSGKSDQQYISDNLMSGSGGNGVGGDAGIMYEYSQDLNHKEGYKARVSVSLMDVGSITYQGPNNYNEIFSGSGYVTGAGILNNVKDFGNIQRYAREHGFTADIRQMGAIVSLPTRLMLAGDYRLAPRWYINFTYLHNLGTREDLGNAFFNQFTFTPRYDTKNFTVGVPVTYSTLSNNYKVGIGIRASAFFVGSDDLLTLMLPNQAGLNVYAGINIPVYK